MITSRSVRGAVNSVFTLKYLSRIVSRVNRERTQISATRSAVLMAVALRMVTAPMPVAMAADPSGDVEPPSTVASMVLAPSEAEPFAYQTFALAEVSVGVSRATEAEVKAREEAAKKAAAKRASAKFAAISAPVMPVGEIQELAMRMLVERYGEQAAPAKFAALNFIVMRESHWNPNAQNRVSTAYGICQFLDSTWRGTGIAKTAEPAGQLQACLTYAERHHGGLEQGAAYKAKTGIW